MPAVFGHGTACWPTTARRGRFSTVAAQVRANHTYIWFYMREPRSARGAEPRLRRRARPGWASRTGSSSVPGTHNWAAVARADVPGAHHRIGAPEPWLGSLRWSAIFAGRVIAVVAAVMLATSLATGWLYWLRAGVAHWPGPRVADALPLDELPGHDGIPLVVYIAAFAIAGLMLGLVARAARLDRLTAGLALAVGTGLWLLAVDAFSLFVVRQVPAGAALRAAARLQAVYLAAAPGGGRRRAAGPERATRAAWRPGCWPGSWPPAGWSTWSRPSSRTSGWPFGLLRTFAPAPSARRARPARPGRRAAADDVPGPDPPQPACLAPGCRAAGPVGAAAAAARSRLRRRDRDRAGGHGPGRPAR